MQDAPAGPASGADPAPDQVTLTRLVHAPLLDSGGATVGRVVDAAVRLEDPRGYPFVVGLKVRIGGRVSFVPASRLRSLLPGQVELLQPQLNVSPFERRAGEVLLREDVLGRRIINVATARLAHANDLLLTRLGDSWFLTGVSSRHPGLLERLLPPAWRRVVATPPIDWKDVHPFTGHIPLANPLLPTSRLRRLHPAQIADLVEASSHEEGEEIIGAVRSDPELTADLFEELDVEHQVEFIGARSDHEAAELLASMAPDDAADLLSDIDQDRRVPILNAMPRPQQQKIWKLLQHNPESAGGLMSPDFVAVTRGTSVAQALDMVRADDKTPVQLLGTVFVTEDDGRFVGSVAVSELLRADPPSPVDEVEEVVGASIRVEDDMESVALEMSDFNLTAIAVVDAEGQLVGAISVDDVLEVLIPDDWRRRAEASRGD